MVRDELSTAIMLAAALLLLYSTVGRLSDAWVERPRRRRRLLGLSCWAILGVLMAVGAFYLPAPPWLAPSR